MSRSPVALATCCNVLVSSLWRHDYCLCKCGRSFVDGGGEYRRYGGEIKWLTKEDGASPEIKALFPAFAKECKRREEAKRYRDWEDAQRLYKEHGIVTRELHEPKPKKPKAHSRKKQKG